MKIAIDCRMHNSSGIGTYLQGILPHLLNEQKNDYLLLGDINILSKYKANNVEIQKVNIPIFSMKELFCFPCSKINSCDAFLTPNFNIPMEIKVPIYAFIHDVVFLDIKGLTSKIGYYIRKYYLKRAINIAKKIFTVSEFSKKRISFHFKKAKDIIVAPCAIKNKLINYFPQKVSNSKEFIIFVGNIKPHKGLDTLVKGWKYAREKEFDKQLIIVGEKEGFKTKLSNEDFLKDKDIIFTGKISDEELYDYISNATVLVQPSIYEGFGLPPLEALYLGTTCLLSDIEVFKELYSDFQNCYSFKRENAKDLGEKLLSISPKKIEQKEFLISHFDFRKTTQIILENIV
ncbi:glycosyltransferase family 1 protein [Capnocytophaga sp. G2]|uniref:glycosyltransferase family 4 protein n=1 Tax=Capnocytophaga sp. G2 TaxID=3110695 RepID=UPI002B47B402|nr:glycosyltransferase family 1 protein [Capnocytophaga sp. G2]MEB3004916.1 glycosyltransferase family 1 protein [Capnocytophaga sp. G2]